MFTSNTSYQNISGEKETCIIRIHEDIFFCSLDIELRLKRINIFKRTFFLKLPTYFAFNSDVNVVILKKLNAQYNVVDLSSMYSNICFL